MSVARRTVLQGALAAAATLFTGTEVALTAGSPPAQPALVVYDSRLPPSRVFQSCYASAAVDLAYEHASLWRNLRGLGSPGSVAGLTCWSDYVQVRALLEERRLRVRTEIRRGSLFYWEMARHGSAATWSPVSS